MGLSTTMNLQMPSDKRVNRLRGIGADRAEGRTRNALLDAARGLLR
jgi:hypothetical protein